jgi:glycosyltransferase involved in cell wall biosynthesis
MRILVVSSFPPRHCGIGSYASAQVERLRAGGDEITVLSPPDGAGDVRVPFVRGREFREARRRGDGFDRILVHFQPSLHYRRGATAAVSKILTSAALLRLVRRRPQTEILVHEAVPHPPRWRPDHALLRAAFARASLLFHTDAERRSLERDYAIATRARLVDHREGVMAHAAPSKGDARRDLGLDPDERLFVCLGFLHPAKGYERAIEAFDRAGRPGRLVVVGSVREPTPENLAYARRLRHLVDGRRHIELREGFVSDDGFDAWIAAADRIVLPYTRAWSSGALAHAGVLGTPAFVSAIGGLPEQAGPDDEIFGSDEELVELFRRFGDDARVPPPDRVAGRP